MSKSYKKIMDKIYIDDAMKQRILQNIEKEQVEQGTPQDIRKKQVEKETLQNIGKNQVKQRIPQNIEKKQEDFSTDNNEKQRKFHYKKISVYVAAILLIFCFTSYFGMSAILHTGRANQHNVASNNKKNSLPEQADTKDPDFKSAKADAKDPDSKSAKADTKDSDSKSAKADTKDPDSKSAKADTKNTDSNQLNTDAVNKEDEADTGAESDTGTLSMEAAHGINQYSSAKELSQKVGYTISDIPSSLIPFKISEKVYSDCGAGLAEIQYYSDKADNVIYRKQPGANVDISGDYTEYSDLTTIKVRSTSICLKGENNKYNLATWSKGNYSYSLYFLNGITEKTFQNILEITI